MTRLTLAALALIMSSAAIAQTAPATDIRSLPRVTGAIIPEGATVTVRPTEATVSTRSTATGDLPRCSRSITERCIRIDRGRRGKMSSHKRRGRHRR